MRKRQSLISSFTACTVLVAYLSQAALAGVCPEKGGSSLVSDVLKSDAGRVVSRFPDFERASRAGRHPLSLEEPLVETLIRQCGHRPIREFADAIQIQVQGDVGPVGEVTLGQKVTQGNGDRIKNFFLDLATFQVGMPVSAMPWALGVAFGKPQAFWSQSAVLGSLPLPASSSPEGEDEKSEGYGEKQSQAILHSVEASFWENVNPELERALVFFRTIPNFTPLNQVLWVDPGLQDRRQQYSILLPDRDLRLSDFFKIVWDPQLEKEGSDPRPEHSGERIHESFEKMVASGRDGKPQETWERVNTLTVKWKLNPNLLSPQPCLSAPALPPSSCSRDELPEDFSSMDARAVIRHHEQVLRSDSSQSKNDEGQEEPIQKTELSKGQKVARFKIVQAGVRRADDVGFAYAIQYRNATSGKLVGRRGKTLYTKNAYFIYRLMTRPPCPSWTVNYAAFNYHNGRSGYAFYYDPDTRQKVRTQYIPTSQVMAYTKAMKSLYTPDSELVLNTCWSGAPFSNRDDEAIGWAFGQAQGEMKITAYQGESRPLGRKADPLNVSDSRLMCRILGDGGKEGPSEYGRVRWKGNQFERD